MAYRFSPEPLVNVVSSKWITDLWTHICAAACRTRTQAIFDATGTAGGGRAGFSTKTPTARDLADQEGRTQEVRRMPRENRCLAAHVARTVNTRVRNFERQSGTMTDRSKRAERRALRESIRQFLLECRRGRETT